MASPYFSGSSPASFLPQGYMEAATAPGRNIAAGISQLGKGIGARIKRQRELKKDDEYFDFIERMGKTPKDKPGKAKMLTERGRPRTDEASGDYFREQMESRNKIQHQVDAMERIQEPGNEADLMGQYSMTLPDGHPLKDLVAESEQELEAKLERNAYDTMMQHRAELADRFLPFDLQGGGALMPSDRAARERFGQHLPGPNDHQGITPLPGALMPRGQAPDQREGLTDEQYAAWEADLEQRQAARSGQGLPPLVYREPDRMRDPETVANEQLAIVEKGLKEATTWAKKQAGNWKDDLGVVEKTLDDFMSGKDKKGQALMELTEKDVRVPLSIKERRDFVMGDLASSARQLGRERYKEAREEVDKLFPKEPEISVKQVGGLSVVTEDGKYKVAMKTPVLAGTGAYDSLPEHKQKWADTMWDKVHKDPTVAGYAASSVALNKMKAAAALDTGFGDSAMIFGFMNTLDPKSTVREGEFALVQDTRPMVDAIWNLYRQIEGGQKLNEKQRAELVAAGQSLVDAHLEVANKKLKGFTSQAKQRGVDPKLILPDFAAGDGGGGGGGGGGVDRVWNPQTQSLDPPPAE
jgi:hypothetical protein